MNDERGTMHERTMERLSEFLDGSLTDGEHDEVAEHLEDCGECRRVLEELRDVVARAGALPTPKPGRDLWPGIAAAIEAPVEAGGRVVIDFPLRRPEDPAGEVFARPMLTPRLAAAAVVLMVASSAATYLVGPGMGFVVRDAADAPAANLAPVLVASLPEVPDELVPPSLTEELATLEAQVLAMGRSLDPETVRLLESNLAIIEQAIADSRRALEQDPANGFLAEHLERTYRRKLEFLREAAGLVEWAS